MSRKLLVQDLETHLFTKHPRREVKSTDLTKTMVAILKRKHDATKRKVCGKNNITSRHNIKYLHSRIYPNFVRVFFELRLVALGNLAIEGIHNPSDRISSSVSSYLNNSYITYYQKQLENMSLDTSNLFECAMKD